MQQRRAMQSSSSMQPFRPWPFPITLSSQLEILHCFSCIQQETRRHSSMRRRFSSCCSRPINQRFHDAQGSAAPHVETARGVRLPLPFFPAAFLAELPRYRSPTAIRGKPAPRATHRGGSGGGPGRPDGAGGGSRNVRDERRSDSHDNLGLNFFFPRRPHHTHAGHALVWAGDF